MPNWGSKRFPTKNSSGNCKIVREFQNNIWSIFVRDTIDAEQYVAGEGNYGHGAFNERNT